MFLHNLHEQFVVFHFLISVLNVSKFLLLLISIGILFQITVQKYCMDSVPFKVVLILGI